MKLICFGSRGSIPSPSRSSDHILGEFNTKKYGGNTTCYYLEAGPFKIILDGGSGIRELGNYLFTKGIVNNNNFIHLITHYHSDHLQGLGFFPHYYMGENVYHIHGFTPEGRDNDTGLRDPVERTIAEQYEAPHFPVSIDAMPASKHYCAHKSQFSESVWYRLCSNDIYEMSWDMPYIYSKEKGSVPHVDENLIKITTIPLIHPNGCIGYRIDYMGKTFTFCTDNEPAAYDNFEITKHGNDSDIMLLDGQYTKKQLSGNNQNFGHGEPKLCVDQAIASNAKELIIHHHDPGHSDEVVDSMQEACESYFQELLTRGDSGSLEKVTFAREGMVWVI
jgi:phosphoribosyl 1,2-cyclic phosphodiesterase